MAKRTAVNDALAKEVHEATLRLMLGVSAYFSSGGRTTNEIVFVPMAIVARMVRVHEATLALLKEGYLQEAAVLALTAFELRIDLLDTASEIKRATAWVEHSNPAQKPGNVKPTLDRLVGKVQADRMYEVFRVLSGIKHGNPLYSDLAFPISKRGNLLMVTTGPIDNVSTRAFSRAIFSYSTYQLAWAAQVVNILVAKYAIVDKPARQKVHDHYVALRRVETEFRAHCRRKLGAKASFFGMKETHGAGPRRERGRAPPDL